jgi:hypothetical protein
MEATRTVTGWAATNRLAVSSWLSGAPVLGPYIIILFKMYPSVKASIPKPTINIQSEWKWICKQSIIVQLFVCLLSRVPQGRATVYFLTQLPDCIVSTECYLYRVSQNSWVTNSGDYCSAHISSSWAVDTSMTSSVLFLHHFIQMALL